MTPTVKNLSYLRIGDYILRRGRNTLTTVVDRILPPRCLLCLTPEGGGFCYQCQQLLPWLVTGCTRCGRKLEIAGLCGVCQNKPIQFDNAVIPFMYLDPVSSHIQRLKYNRRLAVAPALGKILAMQVAKHAQSLPDALVPVPLHSDRLKRRGFNQAQLIADTVGRFLGIPVDNHIVSRTRNTASQTSLDGPTRAKNLRDAFAVHVAGRYDAVAVIDDVVTSGATMGEICSTLRSNGYSNISAWAVART